MKLDWNDKKNPAAQRQGAVHSVRTGKRVCNDDGVITLDTNTGSYTNRLCGTRSFGEPVYVQFVDGTRLPSEAESALNLCKNDRYQKFQFDIGEALEGLSGEAEMFDELEVMEILLRSVQAIVIMAKMQRENQEEET